MLGNTTNNTNISNTNTNTNTTRKIQEICNKIDIRTLNEAWRRWIDYKDLTSSEKSVNVFVKYVGIGRVFDIFAKDLKKKLIRNLRKFKKNTEVILMFILVL